MSKATTRAQFPAKLNFLFRPARYKVAHGGRGSGKSWSFARALLILGAQKKLRILCTREIQKSIKDSVYKLLKDQIESLGLQSRYQALNTEIRGANGTEFLFAGLSDQTAESVKSFEGVDIVWAEEAQAISKRSWDILIPTIRKPGSEIWISMNPELDTDDTYVRFIQNPAEGSFVVQMNYHDNPWFPDVLEQERQRAKVRMTADDYANIWEGRCRKAAQGAIYAQELEASHEQGRIRAVPRDPLLAVHAIWDLGWNDQMTIILAQRSASELRLIDYIEDSHKTLDWYAEEIMRRGYRVKTHWLPHDGTHRNIQTGKSPQEMLQAMGHKVEITPNMAVEDGIRVARMTFGRVYFDAEKASRLLVCLKRYRRSINQQTQEPGGPLHDEFSHGADAFRYLCINADKLTNEDVGDHPIFNAQAYAQAGRRPASRAGY